MAMTNLLAEEDYIDMDISSTTFLCYSTSSPPHAVEFEFQMSLNTPRREALTSPADELFYKGKLLPLHLPPRLQMVQKLLQNSNRDFNPFFEDNAVTTTIPSIAQTAASTPFESCSISPATSCYVSGELNPEDCIRECSYSGFLESQQKKSWAKKLKFISKLKAIRCLFTKSKCAEESCMGLQLEESSNKKAGRKNPFGLIHKKHTVESSMERNVREKLREECGPRRSLSLGANRGSKKTKSCSTSSSCSSSSSSSGSFSSRESYMPRSSSVHSELENSIQGAIAYCKMSQQLMCERRSLSDAGFGPMAASKTAAEKPEICRG